MLLISALTALREVPNLFLRPFTGGFVVSLKRFDVDRIFPYSPCGNALSLMYDDRFDDPLEIVNITKMLRWYHSVLSFLVPYQERIKPQQYENRIYGF